MYITVTMRSHEQSHDIQIDENQPIRAAAVALTEEFGMFDRNDPPLFFKSKMNRKLCSSFFTFSQAGIHTGDILTTILGQ